MIRDAMRVSALVLACSVAAWTQETPKWELTPDYSYARYTLGASLLGIDCNNLKHLSIR
jgi:hypothetical protein